MRPYKTPEKLPSITKLINEIELEKSGSNELPNKIIDFAAEKEQIAVVEDNVHVTEFKIERFLEYDEKNEETKEEDEYFNRIFNIKLN